jgi:hypothetical protein
MLLQLQLVVLSETPNTRECGRNEDTLFGRGNGCGRSGKAEKELVTPRQVGATIEVEHLQCRGGESWSIIEGEH